MPARKMPGVLKTLMETCSVAVGRLPSSHVEERLKGEPSAAPEWAENGPPGDVTERPVLGPESMRQFAVNAEIEASGSSELAPGKKILIVDDDSNLLHVIEMVFHPFDCQFRKARTGQVGLDMALESPPDVFLVDFQMPGMNGYELIMQIRRHDVISRIPIVVISGSAHLENIEECLAWEARAVIRKPAGKEDVIQAVERALGGRLPAKNSDSMKISKTSLEWGFGSDESAAPEPAQPRASRASSSAPIVLPEIPTARREPEEPAPAWANNIDSLKTRSVEALRLIDPAASSADSHAVHAPSTKDDAPIIRLVDGVIGPAVEKKASDVHFEPQEKVLQVRLRVDGELIPILDVPLAIAGGIAARIKIMANLDISERRVPQDGRFSIQWTPDQKLDFRENVLDLVAEGHTSLPEALRVIITG